MQPITRKQEDLNDTNVTAFSRSFTIDKLKSIDDRFIVFAHMGKLNEV